MVCLSLLLGRAPVVAATAEPGLGAPVFPLATNVQQLRQLAQKERRTLYSLHLEGVVCSAGAAKDRLVLQDDSGAELLELDLQGRQLSPGDRVRLEGQGCSVAFLGPGLAIRNEAVVENGGMHGMLRRSGDVYLGAGRHPLRLLWFNGPKEYGLRVSFQGPGLARQDIPDSALFRMEIDPATGLTNMVNGLDYRCYEGRWVNLSAGFGQSKPVKAGHAANFDLGVRTRDQEVGLEFSGYLEVPREGLYTFETESDDGSRLFVAERPLSLERVGAGTAPAPRQLMVAQLLPEDEPAHWTEVEGTVAFASETGAGLRLDLRTDTGRMELAVADGSALSPKLLLHRRVRAVGVGRGVRSLEGPQVLGLLSVTSGSDIKPLEAVPSGTQGPPLLTTLEQVKRLKREEAQRGYPVRIRGVVIRATVSSIVIQDATSGVYVGGLPPRSPGRPRFGEDWEIDGITAPGDFAPVIVWRQGRRLGAGRLPEPVAAHYLAAGEPPSILTDLDSQYLWYASVPFDLSVLVSGSPPLAYQWKRNGTNLSDSATVSGSHSSTLVLSPTALTDSGSYHVVITNQSGAVTSTVAAVTMLSRLGFNDYGSGWSGNGHAQFPFIGYLELTDGTGNEASSSFFSAPVYVGGFQASFTYEDVSDGSAADGMAFVVQNDPREDTALGAAGGGLGYNGITNSVALEFNIYSANGVGFAVRTNGVTGPPYASTAPVNLASGDLIDVSLTYLNGVLSLSLSDATAHTSFTTNLSLNIPALVGGTTAYVGFTGADGSVPSQQFVSDFTYFGLIGLAIEPAPSQGVTLNWPASAGGYVLQQSAAVKPTSWTNVTTSPVAVGQVNQVTLPASASRGFYRLINNP